MGISKSWTDKKLEDYYREKRKLIQKDVPVFYIEPAEKKGRIFRLQLIQSAAFSGGICLLLLVILTGTGQNTVLKELFETTINNTDSIYRIESGISGIITFLSSGF